ncbi:MAG TPA: PIG-L family deacetylase [Acidimicrobiales bacterium]|nr:PIG-L family deacetylase [Acidimicrobiales bacterium]
MGTIVAFHAHPDDESIATAGTVARAVEAGHRAVLVVATRGEHGEIVPGVLADGEQLGVRRVAETFAAAAELGIARVEFLGYLDSGMMGTPENDDPYSFWRADVGHAANRLACILSEERADVLTIYDDHGGYGHPDHIQVHRVGARAATLAGVDHVYEATMNRDHIRRARELARAEEMTVPGPESDSEVELEIGLPEAALTHAVDVRSVLARKRAAMVAHRSQIADDSWFLAMDDDLFATAFGTEWFRRHGVAHTAGPTTVDLLPGLT